MQRSRQLCLKTYQKEQFDPQGWRPVLEESARIFAEPQLRVLAQLYGGVISLRATTTSLCGVFACDRSCLLMMVLVCR